MEGLGINIPLLVSQAVNVIILFVLLRLFAYKPVMRMLDERSRRIKEGVEQSDVLKEKAKNAEQEIKKQIEAAGKQGQEILNRAMRTAEETRQKAQEDARQDGEALIARARMEIKTERDEAIDELRKEFADLTIMAAGKVIGESLDKEAHRQLIDKVLKESASLKKG